jgi:prepilin-type N-terminal cleavage/methylation domain-containing protein
MSIRGSNAKRAFTLLEVMIAVLIIAMIMGSLYRFLEANLKAIRITEEISDERKAVVALVKMVDAELHDLPPKVNGAVAGVAHKFNNLPSDELTWYCKAGNGLFTKAAEGEWYTTLVIQPVNKTSRELEIGLRRRPIDAPETDYKWLSLLRNMNALEVRYFNPQLNNWVERWTDKNTRPSLVRIRIWRTADAPPYEAVIALPSAELQQG